MGDLADEDVLVRRDRPRADGGADLDHRVLHRDRIRAGARRRRRVADGPRHERHRGPRGVDEVDRAAGARGVRCHLGRLSQIAESVRHRDRGDRHAVDDGHDRGARRLRPDHRQRRRHRRNGRPAEGRAQDHRRARCGRQHHQGRHQGLCDRLGRSRRAGAVRGLHPQPRSGRQARQSSRSPIRP